MVEALSYLKATQAGTGDDVATILLFGACCSPLIDSFSIEGTIVDVQSVAGSLW